MSGNGGGNNNGGGSNHGGGGNPPPSSGGDDITKIGALSDGFANTATNSTEIDDGSNGYIGAANGDNRNNDNGTHDSNNDNSTTNTTNTDNSSDDDVAVDVDAKIDVAVGNGDNRENDYDWEYNSKTVNVNDNDNINKTEDSFNSKIEDSYNSKIEDSYNSKTEDKTEDSFNSKIEDSYNSKVEDSNNSKVEDSYNADNDFADLDKVFNTGNFGIAGGDLTFNLGDDFSFTMDVDSILNNSLNGEGNDSGFSVVQANHLADQDYASDLKMNNEHADNNLKAEGGSAWGDEGINSDGHGWDLKAGDDVSGTSTADASAILANSGFHMELVQGANMLSNAVDSTIAGGNVSDVGEDHAGS